MDWCAGDTFAPLYPSQRPARPREPARRAQVLRWVREPAAAAGTLFGWLLWARHSQTALSTRMPMADRAKLIGFMTLTPPACARVTPS